MNPHRTIVNIAAACSNSSSGWASKYRCARGWAYFHEGTALHSVRILSLFCIQMSSLLNAESVRTKKCWKICASCDTWQLCSYSRNQVSHLIILSGLVCTCNLRCSILLRIWDLVLGVCCMLVVIGLKVIIELTYLVDCYPVSVAAQIPHRKAWKETCGWFTVVPKSCIQIYLAYLHR